MHNIRESLAYYGKKSLPFYLWLFLSSLVSGLVPVLYIYLPKLILDELLGAKRPEVLWQLVIVLAAGALVFNVFKNFANLRFEAFSFDLINDLTEKSVSKVMRIPYQDSEAKTFLDFERTGFVQLGIPLDAKRCFDGAGKRAGNFNRFRHHHPYGELVAIAHSDGH